MLTASSVVCQRCPLACEGRKSIVDGIGKLSSKLMCIAEAPGRDEDRTGTPLVGASGRLLRSVIAEICAFLKVDATEVWYTNVCRCRPKDNHTPTQEEVDACIPWLQTEIDEIQPRCILALGATAKGALADLDTTAEFVGTWHPAYILRQRSKLDAWKEDVEDAIRLAFGLSVRVGGPYDDTRYSVVSDVVEEPLKQFEWGYPDPNAKYLSVDTEFDDLEEHVGQAMVGWSASDGERAIFTTEPVRSYPHVYVHRADADLENLGIDPDDLTKYDDTIEMAYPLQQKYGWPFLGLKRPDGRGLAQILPDPPVVWKHQLKSDLLRVWQPSGAVFKSGPRKGLEKPGKWKKKVQFSEVLRDRTADAKEYGATDGYGTSRLAETLEKLLDAEPWARHYYETIEKPLIPVLLQMERTGININAQALNDAGIVIDAKRRETELRLRETFAPEINIGSNPQIGSILLDRGIVDGKLTESGQIGCSEKNILDAFGIDDWIMLPDTPDGRLAHDLLEWREMGKLRSTYVNGILNSLDPKSRIHPRFNSTGAYTNRLSSSDPNAQNIPSRSQIGMAIRRSFIASRGCALVGGDCSQIQLRGFGELTLDPIFLDAYTRGALRGCLSLCKCPECDIHQRFTNMVNSWGYRVERSSHTGGPSMKNGVFSTLYGVEAKKLAKTIGIPEEKAEFFLTQMKDAAPSIVTWPQIASSELSSKGYVETLLGWRMYFPDYGSVVNKWHQAAIREAACGKVQGLEAGLVKAILIETYNTMRKEFPAYKMILTVHDEWWAEGPEGTQAEEVRHMMKETAERVPKKWMKTVPIVFDDRVIHSWDEAK